MKLIGELPPGPLDIIGDVHGEIAALERLLAKLGYDEAGRHPRGRHLVFAGDLTDRGPDSPAVLERVAALVEAGRARCIVGNHELNLLRDVPKHGNDWWVEPGSPTRLPARAVTPEQKERFTAFLQRLPLALEREDLRVVHACWSPVAIDALRKREPDDVGVLELYREHAEAFHREWHSPEREAALRAEARGIDVKDPDAAPPLLPLRARYDAQHQVSNPVSVLTSGEEEPTAVPFYAGGRWRMVERVKWWERYDEPVPVVVGHYWRRYDEASTLWVLKDGPDLFEGIEPHRWMGRRGNVYCVDFSVGGRSEQRHREAPEQVCQLAALRVPDWQVVHDDGDTWDIGPPGR